MVRPSQRREMARWVVEVKGESIRQACADFTISATCYRYQPKRSDENAVIADWLIRLTHNQRNWGFGLCFLHLRNVKGHLWNHKRVYRIYRELELNLRIKPKCSGPIAMDTLMGGLSTRRGEIDETEAQGF